MSQVTVIQSDNTVGWSLLVIIVSLVTLLLVTFGFPHGSADTQADRPTGATMVSTDTGDSALNQNHVEGRVAS